MSTNGQKRTVDPGLGEKYSKKTKRFINKDGTFNVKREGIKVSSRNIYHSLINMSWGRFLLLVLAFYILVNSFFALLYCVSGFHELEGMVDDSSFGRRFMSAFFFSVQTFTSVGYGAIAPAGMVANIIASVEALVGLMSFALATGLFYGRFSKPSARLLFSKSAIIAPYRGISSFQFRVINQRQSTLLNMEANVLLNLKDENSNARRYYRLPLEVDQINFFALNWTIVHPIDDKSPLHNKSSTDLRKLDAEILIQMSGFDDTFSQYVHKRYSYKYDEIHWNLKFKKAWRVEDDGQVVIDVNEIHATEHP